MKQLTAFIRRDGWLIAVILLCCALCLLLRTAGHEQIATSEEARISRVLSAMEGAGRVEVVLYYQKDGSDAQPCGAVVVADGAKDMAVQLRLHQAVMKLLHLDAEAVGIYAREGI